MNQSEKAARFAALHVKGAPLLLYNAWDAGSAQAILERRKGDRDQQLAVAEAQATGTAKPSRLAWSSRSWRALRHDRCPGDRGL